MAKSGEEPANETSKSLSQRFMEHARGPKGFASIVNELKYALTDIRHKLVEEATYGRAVTPHWREPAPTPQAPGGIHGDAKTPAGDAGPGIHGKTDTPQPDAGSGVHGKSAAPEKTAEAAGVHGKAPAEPKGLGMSYAELSASWDKAYGPDQAASREREPARQPEHAIER